MNNMNKIAMLMAALLLSGCAGVMRQAPDPGDPTEVVQAKMGTPTGVYQDGDVRVLEYATGPMGQFTYMARLGSDGRLAPLPAKPCGVREGNGGRGPDLHYQSAAEPGQRDLAAVPGPAPGSARSSPPDRP